MLLKIFIYANIFFLPCAIIGYGVALGRSRDMKRKWLHQSELVLVKQAKIDSLERCKQAAEKSRDTYRTEFKKAKEIIADLKENGNSFHNGDLSPREEAELLTRMDEILAENDALMDEVEALKKT